MQWLAEICVKRPVFATMLILSLVTVGAFSFFSLGVDLFPKIDFPTITVTVVNPGASPQEIETDITEKIEEAVNTVSGIDELRSSSIEGISQVFVQFVLEKDVNIAAQEVENRVQTVIPNLPETAEQPTVQKLDTDAAPVLRIVVSGPTSLRDVTEVADKQIKQRIESVSGVGQITIIGGRERQINVWVDPDKMRSYNVTPAEVSTALRLQNIEFPSGRLDEGQTETSVRTLGKIRKPEDFAEIVVATRGTYQVKVKDIGYVEDGAEEIRSQALLNGQPAVTLVVSKQSGQNTVAVAHGVKERLNEIAPTLPKDFRVEIIGDNSIFIENSLHSIEEHLIVGGFLAVIVVFLFLWNLRSTFIAALAIPTSIISTFALMYAMDYTLNSITMLSLTLMVGIVIDDAIVVLENIYRFVEEKGMPPFQAAIEGTREIGLAVLATTLSLLAVFIPVGFMEGIVGRFMSSFGLTSAAAIAVSLIVSFTLTPMLAARWIKPKLDEDEGAAVEPYGAGEAERAGDGLVEPGYDEPVTNRHAPEESTGNDSKDSWFYRKIDAAYTFLLKLSMRFRWAIVLICVLVVASIYPLYNFVGMAFLPDEDESAFDVNLRAPQGTSLSATQSILDRIARDMREQMPEVKTTLVLAGWGGGSSGRIFVSLVPVSERKKSQADLINQARGIARKYANKDFRVNVSGSSSISGSLGLGRGGSGIGFYIAGPDQEKLKQYGEALVAKLEQDPLFRDPDTSEEEGAPELQIKIDRKKAADLGVRAGDVAQALNIAAAGQRVSTFSEGTEQYDVVVQADEPFRRDRNNLQYFTVASSSGTPVGLEKLVTIEEGTSPATINRLNRQRQITISASLPPNASESDALEKIQAYARELNMPPEYRTGVTGQSKELQRAYESFMLAFLLSFVFMYLILAAQFESFIHPVTILLTLPLSVPFALLSTALAGQTLNIFSALGILLLFGIVKKNAILQIDHTNHLREKGMARYDAIIQANRDRLRPILMTTLALVAGMIPLTLGTGAGAATNRSIGILVVGGQSLCLLLTLLAVPVFYSLFDDAQQSQLFRGFSGRFDRFKSRVLHPVYERFRGSYKSSKIDREPVIEEEAAGGEGYAETGK
jgi:HAE1 family hydrophobic/amphiphilic exporter-1